MDDENAAAPLADVSAHDAGQSAASPRRPQPGQFYAAHLFVCTNRRAAGHKRGSCAEGGSEPLRDYMKARAKEMGLPRVRVNSAGCLDRCELGPCVVIYPEGVWYRAASREDIDAILERHLRDGGRATELLLPDEG